VLSPKWIPSIRNLLGISTQTAKTGREAWLLALLFFIPLVIYWPGLHGDFFLDDYPHIVHNQAIQIDQLDLTTLWTAANSTNSGPLGRPLALASFAINYYFTGLDPYYFKLANLLIHILTSIGVFYLLRGITMRLAPEPAISIAFIAALLWSVHPLNVSTVLYSVQRMTGLATLFMVWGMVAYNHGRERLLECKKAGWSWVLLSLAAGFLGMYAKETAVLILGYLLVIECLVFRFRMSTAMQRHVLQGSYAAIIGLPLAWALTTSLFSPGWTDSAYANRSFTLNERLLTEGRVLWDYLYLTWLPNIQSMGLYHDGYPISRGLFEPSITFISAAAHVLLIGAAFALRKQWPLLLFAVAWFYVGHSAESTVLPLELKYEHRNYLPMLGMLLLMIHGIYAAASRLKNVEKIRTIVLVAVVLTFSGSALVRTSQFGDFWGFAGMEAEHYPESSRANQHAAISLTKFMIENGRSNPTLIAQTTKYLQRSADANQNSTAPLFTAVLFMPRFTHSPPAPELVEELSARLRHALPDANINSYFSALLRQATEGKLLLTHAQVQTLFDNAEENPRMRREIKADIIAVRAAYTQSVERDNAKARTIIERAIATEPSASGIYVPAVWIYQEAGMWQDAARLLEKLRELDAYGIESHSIAWLSQRQHNQSTNNR
jgi:hypothetical protein